MKMRWYQHSEQVGSFMISPKNKAPSVDALAISHATKMIVQPVVVSDKYTNEHTDQYTHKYTDKHTNCYIHEYANQYTYEHTNRYPNRHGYIKSYFDRYTNL